jgi:hypothetical protein
MRNLKRGAPQTLHTKIAFICSRGFSGDDILEIDQPETGIAYGGHVL